MKVLFVCRANVARSQIAQILFEEHTSSIAYSAGTKVETDGISIKEKNVQDKPLLDFFRKYNKDLDKIICNQIKKEILEQFDIIVVMAEIKTVPEYLMNNKKIIFWNIEDPKGQTPDKWNSIILKIDSKIKNLIKKIYT